MFLEIEQPLPEAANGESALPRTRRRHTGRRRGAPLYAGRGLGMKFVAIEKDCGRQFAELLTRFARHERSRISARN